MSPTIRAVPAIESSQSADPSGGPGGTTSAMAMPNRVTRTGWPVLRTCFNTARQVALNLDMDSTKLSVIWSKLIVKAFP